MTVRDLTILGRLKSSHAIPLSSYQHHLVHVFIIAYLDRRVKSHLCGEPSGASIEPLAVSVLELGRVLIEPEIACGSLCLRSLWLCHDSSIRC